MTDTDNERITLNRNLPNSLMGELDAIYFYIGFLQLEILNQLPPENAKKVEEQLEKTVADKRKSLGRSQYDAGYEIGLRTLLSKLT